MENCAVLARCKLESEHHVRLSNCAFPAAPGPRTSRRTTRERTAARRRESDGTFRVSLRQTYSAAEAILVLCSRLVLSLLASGDACGGIVGSCSGASRSLGFEF